MDSKHPRSTRLQRNQGSSASSFTAHHPLCGLQESRLEVNQKVRHSGTVETVSESSLRPRFRCHKLILSYIRLSAVKWSRGKVPTPGARRGLSSTSATAHSRRRTSIRNTMTSSIRLCRLDISPKLSGTAKARKLLRSRPRWHRTSNSPISPIDSANLRLRTLSRKSELKTSRISVETVPVSVRITW